MVIVAAVKAVEFQSTHPRGVRLRKLSIIKHFFRVSIHAPARGVTSETWRTQLMILVSIHAPARGATVHFLGTLHKAA